jgi:hypothetical protein
VIAGERLQPACFHQYPAIYAISGSGGIFAPDPAMLPAGPRCTFRPGDFTLNRQMRKDQ